MTGREYGKPRRVARLGQVGGGAKASTTASAERFASDLHSKIKASFDSKMARKFEAKAERFERKLKQRIRQADAEIQRRQRADPSEGIRRRHRNSRTTPSARSMSARADAPRPEAGFYVHLMWYGIIIGFLFLSTC